MNTYQQKLWDELMSLVETSETFYFADQEIAGQKFRIFNYRLSNYSEFLLPSALECRGHMFEIEGESYDAVPVRLAALPMEKFFNLYENPFTMDLDLSTVVEIEDKADGSLISSYMAGNGLYLKSKGSLASEQAIDAMHWLRQREQYHNEINYLTEGGRTVNLEWVAPHNRIVIGYEEPELRVLNIRDTRDGSYMHRSELNPLAYKEIHKHWTKQVETDHPVEFVEAIPHAQGIEGYVLRLDSGQRVKVKTQWYLALHHTKDNINSPRRLFEAVLEEATDDMRTLFHDDPLAIQTIQEMEDFVAEKYNHMVDSVERFYERNKHLERKEYAILGQEEFKGTFYFGLAMSRYLGKDPDYKNFLKGKWKQLGLKDETLEEG